jgi:hypothetical protein
VAGGCLGGALLLVGAAAAHSYCRIPSELQGAALNLQKAGAAGGGPPGGLGIDEEFMESVLVPQVMLYGFLGFEPTAEGWFFRIEPNGALPDDLMDEDDYAAFVETL